MKKTFFKRFFELTLAASIGLLGLTGCGETATSSLSDSTDSVNEELVIRVADFQQAIWNDQFKVAYEKGWFDEAFEGQNVKVEVINFANGPAVNEAFIAGEVDLVNGIGDQPFVIGVGNNIDAVVFAGAAKQANNIGIIAKADAGIKSVSDLKNKKIGVFLGTYVHKSLIGILNDAGISEDDVDIVNITSTSDADAAFASGDIDAYLSMSADHIIKNVETNDFIFIQDCSNHPAYSYLVGTKTFADNHRDVLKTYISTLYRAEKWINENQEESYKIIADFSGRDITEVRNTNEKADRTIKLDDDWIDNFTVTYNFLKERDLITVEVSDEKLKAHIDTSILDEVVN